MPEARFRYVAVFCGASSGSSPEYLECARALGRELVKRQIGLVYGGGSVGLMGAVSQTVYDGLGEGSVIGVIPEALVPREVSGESVGEIRVVPDMHTRKKMMSDQADAFIGIPGGFGTLEELLEMITWQQLGIHQKPVAVLNMKGFYDHLLAFFDVCVTEGFVREEGRKIVVEASQPAELLDKLQAYQAPVSLVERLAAESRAAAKLAG
ncbi:hypothetical protein WJX72_009660 [[Myrmecia] bisecta]|uniref:Cytokinin riboside 5'-monophosphate phosphoribohydrolase n=1 Tax=[Myrmecia] bisecta TaxID=41462 RepID=A0AAW1R8W0_9CHLO